MKKDEQSLSNKPKKGIRLINSSLRDGLQAQWSGRLGEKQILPIVRSLDMAGYEAIDLMAPVQFEVCVKYLKENPWHRVRSIRAAVHKTPLFTHLRSRSLTSFDLVHDSVFNLWVERIAANGLQRTMIFDALHDSDNLRTSTVRAKAAGLEVCLILFYTISPFHTDEYYAKKARELASFGADSICIRDPSGLLTPERVAELIPKIRQNIGVMPLYLKSHCTTGLAEDSYIEAAKNGVDALFVATEPLAHGASVPSIGRVARRLAEIGMSPGLDMSKVEDEEQYFFELAKRLERPIGVPVHSVDASQYEHQIPGNMIAFTQGQLNEMKLGHLLPEVLDEFTQVRADMGYPVMVTPISQLVCVQAVLNVVQKERYKSIPNEVRKYVQGYYGKPDAPIASALADRVGPRTLQAAEEDPLMRAREKYGAEMSDDDLLLRILFRPEQTEGLLFDGPLPGRQQSTAADADVLDLIKSCARLTVSSLEVKRKNFVFIGKRFVEAANEGNQ